ncbi:T9SS type A sorting domain-containing protein [candidate division WOR-3 bacterium]|nr:T9SS type A sorting domain-containing protein [candidate division WOR-3 bacterium]
MERLVKGLIVAFAVISPLYLYGVNEGYSVITESSPWGCVIVWFPGDSADEWREEYCPKLDSMKSCGISWDRPTCGPPGGIDYPGVFPRDWKLHGSDSMIVYMLERDMNWLWIGFPPDWMTDSTKWPNFWHKIVEYLDGDGVGVPYDNSDSIYPEYSLTKYKPVKYWNICNEPNDRGSSNDHCYGGTVDHFRLYTMISHEAIHDADTSSEVKVVAPSINDIVWYFRPDSSDTAASPVYWLARVLEGTGVDYIDIISHHYPFRNGSRWFDSYDDYLDCLEDTLEYYHADNKPFWLTEEGVATYGMWDSVSEDTQAIYYKEWCAEMLDRDWPSKGNKIFFFSDGDCNTPGWGLLDTNFCHKPAFDTLYNFIHTNTPFDTLTSPTGGEDWACDSVCNITWTASDIQTPDNALTINIAYSTDSGKTWIAVTEMEENDGTYQWTIPNTPSNFSRVRIRARDSDYLEGQYISGIFAISDRTPPSVSLLIPEGGEIWEIGGLKKIEWTEPTDNVGVDIVKVLFKSNYPGGQWDTIACVSPETTYYHWEIPDTTSSTCRIKVIAFDEALNSCEDMCDANFEVGPLFSTTKLATAYNNQRKVCVGASDNIYMVYHSGGVNDRVLFDYSSDNGDSWNQKGIGNGKFPAIGIDYSDGLDICWIQQIEDEAGLWLRRKTMDWEDAVEIFHFPSDPPLEPPFQDFYLFPPSFAIDESDTVHICVETLVEYTDPTPGTYAWEWKLRYGKISVINPDTIYFETLDTAFVSGSLPPPYDSVYNYYCSSICLDRKGHPHITWCKPFWAETEEIYYRVMTDTGWSSIFNISESPNTSSSHPFIDIYGDFVNVVWEEGENISHIRKWLYGDWEESDITIEGRSPQVLDGCVITYSDSVSGKGIVFYKEFDRIDWEDSVVLSDMYGDCNNPQSNLTNSILTVVWTEDKEDIYKVGMGIDTVFIPWQKSDTNLATAYNNGRKIIRDTDGRIHIVYQSDGYIYYAYTDDSLFSCDFLVGEGELPCISLDTLGNPWIMWRNTSCDSILFSKFDYDSFTTPVSVYNNDTLSAPSFVISEDNEAHLSVGILSSNVCRVIYCIFDGTQTSHTDTLDSYEGDMTRPSFAYEEEKGKILAVWDKGGSIYYRETEKEKEWSDEEVISGEIDTCCNPQIDYYDGFVYVVWQAEDGDYNIYYTSKPINDKWADPIKVYNSQQDSKYPVVGGGIHVIWEEETQSGSLIYYFKVGSEQKEPENLSGDIDAYCAYSAYYTPAIGDPNLFVVWTQKDTPYRINMIKKIVTSSGGKMGSSSGDATGPGNTKRLSAVSGGALLAFTSGNSVMYTEYSDSLDEPLSLGSGRYPSILQSGNDTKIFWNDSCGIYSFDVTNNGLTDTILTDNMQCEIPLAVTSSDYRYHIGIIERSENLWRIKHGIKRDNLFTEFVIDSINTQSMTSPLSISKDRIGNIHIVWEKDGNIYYTNFIGIVYGVYDTLSNTNLSKNPSIDVYGARVRVVWEDDGEVMLKSRWIGQPWEDMINLSRTYDSVSCDPFIRYNSVIWSEEGGIRLRMFDSDIMDWGNVIDITSQDARYPQVDFYQTTHSTDMWLAWTEGIGPSYDVILKSYKVARVPYICLNLGLEEPSVFTIRRNGYTEYGEDVYKSMDTDPLCLLYRIPGLDPGKKYRITLTYYQESGDEWEMRLSGDIDANTVIPSNTQIKEKLWVPEYNYLDGVLTLVITKALGDYAICSGIVIHEFEIEGGNGGTQSLGDYRIFSLSQNYPNPARGKTVIRYSIPKSSNVSLKIYDICGRLVKTIIDERKPAGYYRVTWDGKDNKDNPVSNGVYFARLVAGDNSASRKLVIVK